LEVAHASCSALLGSGSTLHPGASLERQHEFCDAAKDWDFEEVRTMLEAEPALVNAQPAGRWSALHQAAAAGNVEMVTFLLGKGADRDAHSKEAIRVRVRVRIRVSNQEL